MLVLNRRNSLTLSAAATLAGTLDRGARSRLLGMEGTRPDDGGSLWFEPDRYGPTLSADVPNERTRLLAASQRPIAMRSFGENASSVAWRVKPSWYHLSKDDSTHAPELQRWMADRIKAGTVAVPSSHMSPISHADVIVKLIEQAAQV